MSLFSLLFTFPLRAKEIANWGLQNNYKSKLFVYFVLFDIGDKKRQITATLCFVAGKDVNIKYAVH